jgi:hypothetical protein
MRLGRCNTATLELSERLRRLLGCVEIDYSVAEGRELGTPVQPRIEAIDFGWVEPG